MGCENINGLILFSPVDGLDPFGFLDYYCITPGEKLNFETPTLIVSVGYDNTPGSALKNLKQVLARLRDSWRCDY